MIGKCPVQVPGYEMELVRLGMEVTEVIMTKRQEAVEEAVLLEEDKVVGALKLNLTADRVHETPIDDVFAR